MESAFKKHLFKVAELEESLKSEKAMGELTDEERWGHSAQNLEYILETYCNCTQYVALDKGPVPVDKIWD